MYSFCSFSLECFIFYFHFVFKILIHVYCCYIIIGYVFSQPPVNIEYAAIVIGGSFIIEGITYCIVIWVLDSHLFSTCIITFSCYPLQCSIL